MERMELISRDFAGNRFIFEKRLAKPTTIIHTMLKSPSIIYIYNMI